MGSRGTDPASVGGMVGESPHRNVSSRPVVLTLLILAGAALLGIHAPSATRAALSLFSVSLLVGIFMFAWHTRAFITSDYFLLLGLSSLAIALLHSVQMLSHPSVSVLPGGAEVSARALAAATGFLSISLLIAPTYLVRRLRPVRTHVAYGILCATVLAAIFLVPQPRMSMPSGAPTLFNTGCDAATALILLLGLVRLRPREERLDADVLKTVVAAVAAAIVAQTCFGLQALAGDIAGLAGYIALAFAYFLFFRAVVEMGLSRPHSVLFYDLKQSEANIREMSRKDELTGLLNRRGFFSLAEQRIRMSQQTGHNMLLFYCDLDAMKAINDSMGHREGDRALCDVAQILRETFRESDIIARFGGDEFVVLAIETDTTSVALLRDRLETNVASFNSSVRRPYDLRLSIGIATYDPLLTETLDDVLSRADVQMYRHKQGRKWNETASERSTAWSD